MFVSEPMHDDWSGNCCALGHEGDLCAYCKTSPIRYDMGDNGCVPCESPHWFRLVMLFLGWSIYSTVIVISKHYSINIKNAFAKKKKMLQPMGPDLPRTGAELQDAVFWMQTLSLLDLSSLLDLIFEASPSAGLTTCLVWLSPLQKAVADLYFPPLYLLSVVIVMHFCVACLQDRDRPLENSEGLYSVDQTKMSSEDLLTEVTKGRLTMKAYKQAQAAQTTRGGYGIGSYNHKLKSAGKYTSQLQLLVVC